MVSNLMETSNKKELMAAIMACPYGEKTIVINRGANGRETRFTIGVDADKVTEQTFERMCKSKVSKIKRIPAHVWE